MTCFICVTVLNAFFKSFNFLFFSIFKLLTVFVNQYKQIFWAWHSSIITFLAAWKIRRSDIWEQLYPHLQMSKSKSIQGVITAQEVSRTFGKSDLYFSHIIRKIDDNWRWYACFLRFWRQTITFTCSNSLVEMCVIGVGNVRTFQGCETRMKAADVTGDERCCTVTCCWQWLSGIRRKRITRFPYHLQWASGYRATGDILWINS